MSCSPGCPGYGLFHVDRTPRPDLAVEGKEFQRCDECGLFESDAAAHAHWVAAGKPTLPGQGHAIRFTCGDDYGPYETLFRAFQGYNVQINGEEVTIKDVDGAGVTAHAWLPEDLDEGTGPLKAWTYDAIESLFVY